MHWKKQQKWHLGSHPKNNPELTLRRHRCSESGSAELQRTGDFFLTQSCLVIPEDRTLEREHWTLDPPVLNKARGGHDTFSVVS